MKVMNILILFTTALFSFSVFAQSEEEMEPQNKLGFSNEESALNFFSEQAQLNSNVSQKNDHLIYIDQSGTDNQISSKITAESSTLRIWQDGNNNYAEFDIRAKTFEQDLIQKGNGNRYFNITDAPNTERNVEVSQNGNNTDVTIYGGNSMSENMKVNMQGSDRSLIIRNF